MATFTIANTGDSDNPGSPILQIKRNGELIKSLAAGSSFGIEASDDDIVTIQPETPPAE